MKWIIGASIAAVAVAVGVVLFVTGGAEADEVRFQPATATGTDPFTEPADVPSPGTASASAAGEGGVLMETAGIESTPSEAEAVPSEASAEAASPSEEASQPPTVCDREALFGLLAADPARLSAYAEVVDVEATEKAVGAYVRGLTPATLTQDTQVTDHAYDDGEVTPFQAILTQGTAVLVDDDDQPVTRCRSGSPLADPVQLAEVTECFDCPADYQPPPPCEGECLLPEPGAPPVAPTGTPPAPPATTPAPGATPSELIATSRKALEACRAEKGSLEACRTEYEQARTLCAQSPLAPSCDSTICFDAAIEVSRDGCPTYLDREVALGFCLQMEDQAKKAACLTEVDAVVAKCVASPLDPDCTIDPAFERDILIFHCVNNASRPECPGLQVGCVADPTEPDCADLRAACTTGPQRPDCVAVEQLRVTCAKEPRPPECEGLPPIPTLTEEEDDPADEALAEEPETGELEETDTEAPLDAEEGTGEIVDPAVPDGGVAPTEGAPVPAPEAEAPAPVSP